MFLHVCVCPQGGYLGRYPSGTRYTPKTRYTSRTRYTPWDQVHSPRTRYTSRTRYTPWDQVHSPRTRYTSPNQVHPIDQVHPRGPDTPPGLGTPPRRLLSQTVRILLECILVCSFLHHDESVLFRR